MLDLEHHHRRFLGFLLLFVSSFDHCTYYSLFSLESPATHVFLPANHKKCINLQTFFQSPRAKNTCKIQWYRQIFGEKYTLGEQNLFLKKRMVSSKFVITSVMHTMSCRLFHCSHAICHTSNTIINWTRLGITHSWLRAKKANSSHCFL